MNRFSANPNYRESLMYIADMHCDSILTVNSERGIINKYNFSREYPQLQLMAAFVPCGGKTPEERRRNLMRYADIYIAECQRLDLLRVTNCFDLNMAIQMDRRSAMLSVEGGAGLFADSEELNTLHRLGMRVLGMAWDSNELAAGAWGEDDYGLTKDGVELVGRCSELGIIMDVSHLSDRSFYDLLEVTSYPVIATHSNFRAVADSPRNLTLDQARKISARGGVIGLNLYPPFLSGEEKATSDHVLRHVDYALTNLGEDCLGFGFDLDGFDCAQAEGLTESRSIHDQVVELLLKNYSEGVVRKLAGENVINFFKSNI